MTIRRRGALPEAWCLVMLIAVGVATASGQDRAVDRSLADSVGIGLPVYEQFRLGADGILTLRPFIVKGSLRVLVSGRAVPVEDYVLDEVAGRLILGAGAFEPGDLLSATYRVLLPGIPPVFRLDRRPAEWIGPSRTARGPSGSGRDAPTVSASGLRSRGSVTRGVLVGTGRDVSIESGLRLQVDGSPAPGVTVMAVLTDETTPIRPDGTTQRLDEFDRVAVSLSGRPGTVRLGDFDVRLSESRFGGFTRSLQGASVEGRVGFGSGATATVKGVGATARGLFRTQTLAPIDGVQGPYRLEGNAGETFILIVPGTEVVYMDGTRLERGRGYTIDYATGELTFTPERVVTSDRRISVDFTYSLNQFTRTVTASESDVRFWGDETGRPRASLGVTWLREADGKQFLEEFGLSAADSLLLAGAGDGGARRSGAMVVAYDAEAPYTQYRREVRGADTVFVALDRTPEPGETIYRVSFSRVGEGNGHYARSGESVNGIVYVWTPGGAYDAIRRLPQPSRRQLLDLRARLSPVPWLTVGGEWSRSENDLNVLSALDAEDDAGSAARIEVRAGDSGRGRISAGLLHERIDGGFQGFDRIRSLEFAREWNLVGRTVNPTAGIEGGETRSAIDVAWNLFDSTRVSMEGSRLDVGDAFAGRRLLVEGVSSEHGKPDVRWSLQSVSTTDSVGGDSGSWLAVSGRIAAPITWRITPFLETEIEDRRLSDPDGVLRPASVSFQAWRPGLGFATERVDFTTEIERRIERWPIGTRQELAARSWTGRGSARLGRGSAWSGGVSMAYRHRDFTETFAGAAGAVDTRALLLSVDGDGRLSDRFGVTWSYEGRTERTPRLQEVYFRTGPERGEFVWVDENGDGIIQVDEFLPEATSDEGLYVRTFLPSDSLLSVTAVRSRVRLNLDTASDGWLGMLSGQTVFEVEERSRTPDRADVYLLRLDRFRRAGQTTDGRLRIRQDVSLFRGNPRYGLDASYTLARSLSELAAGLETRGLDAVELSARTRPSRGPEWGLTARLDRNRTDSYSFASRRFDIRTRHLAPSLRWRRGSGGSLRGSLELSWKTDAVLDRSSRVLRIPVSLRLSSPGRTDAIFRFEVADVSLEGNASGLAAWELTEGRGAGTSFLWGTTFQWSIGRSLRATLGYDGRAPSAGRTIHTGRLEVSALF